MSYLWYKINKVKKMNESHSKEKVIYKKFIKRSMFWTTLSQSTKI